MDFAGDLKTINGQREITPSRIDASAALTGLTYSGQPAGSAKLTAKSNGERSLSSRSIRTSRVPRSTPKAKRSSPRTIPSRRNFSREISGSRISNRS